MWLAGLLEGEGCFYLQNKKYPGIKLQMCDEDVVVRAAALMKSKVNHYGNTRVTRLYGVYAIEWMMILYTLLGKRRRERIREIIQAWKEHTYYSQRGLSRMATCHPDRPFYALGLCKVCYDKKRNAEKRLLKLVG